VNGGDNEAVTRRACGAAAILGRSGAVALSAAAVFGVAVGWAAGGLSAGRPVDPSRFLPGSCVSFAPTAAGPERTVFVDAGHGGPDPGAVGVTLRGKPVHEADETLRVALRVLPLLRADGYRVVLSRTTAAAVARPLPGDRSGGLFTGQGVHHDLAARDACANLVRADILIGVYFNASDYDSTGGSLTLYDAARPFWQSSRRLARLVQRDVLARLNEKRPTIADDGVHTDSGYGSSVTSADQAYDHLLILGPAKRGYFSSPSEMPGALIEPLFITNPDEASLADSAPGELAIAQGLAMAVRQYFRSG
jgi:N-acetylmuramoyl-L-alanine amidase